MSKRKNRKTRAETFLQDFVHPLVAGGELHVARPLDLEDLDDLRHDAVLAGEGLSLGEELVSIERARQLHAQSLWPYPVPSAWDDISACLTVGVHNLLFLSHPDATGATVRRAARDRLVRFTIDQLKRSPLPTRDEDVIARHTLLGNLLLLSRTDVDLSCWAVSYQFRGMAPPNRLRRWPRLRRVREERHAVRWFFEEKLAEPQEAILGQLLRLSPLTDLLSLQRSRPVFSWLPLLPYLQRPELCRLVCHLYVEMGLAVVGPALAQTFWQLVSVAKQVPERQRVLQFVISLIYYLYATQCLQGELQAEKPAEGSPLAAHLPALLVAAAACGLLPRKEVIGDDHVEARMMSFIAAHFELIGDEATTQAARLRAALE